MAMFPYFPPYLLIYLLHSSSGPKILDPRYWDPSNVIHPPSIPPHPSHPRKKTIIEQTECDLEVTADKEQIVV